MRSNTINDIGVIGLLRVYNGKPKKITLINPNKIPLKIKYFDINNNELAEGPIEIGDYKVVITGENINITKKIIIQNKSDVNVGSIDNIIKELTENPFIGCIPNIHVTSNLNEDISSTSYDCSSSTPNNKNPSSEEKLDNKELSTIEDTLSQVLNEINDKSTTSGNKNIISKNTMSENKNTISKSTISKSTITSMTDILDEDKKYKINTDDLTEELYLKKEKSYLDQVIETVYDYDKPIRKQPKILLGLAAIAAYILR